DQGLAAATNEQVRVRVGGDAEGVERLLHLPSRLLAQRGVVVELPPRAWLARRDLELPRPERELPARSRLHLDQHDVIDTRFQDPPGLGLVDGAREILIQLGHVALSSQFAVCVMRATAHPRLLSYQPGD